MRNFKIKEAKGITLVALVVTMVVLVILAGVSISLVLGQYGIIGRAQTVGETQRNAQSLEEAYLQNADLYINEQIALGGVVELRENSADTEAGTPVKMPESWKTEGVATVTAVAGGAGETVPIPENFVYVGGTLNSGLVISDDPRDKDKYAGVEVVPAGVVYNNDGTPKTYTDVEYEVLTAEQKRAVILGNQFVWIPCTTSNTSTKIKYQKNNVWNGTTQTSSVLANAGWDTTTASSELPQIQKYEGFYVGRYEAGSGDVWLSSFSNTGSNQKNFTTATTGVVDDAFSIRSGLNHSVISGKITSKAGEIPYFHADYYTAVAMSEAMYNTTNLNSGLITGTMWDVMLQFIGNNSQLTDSQWGNYSNYTLTGCSGRYAKVTSEGVTEAWIKNSTSDNKSGGTYTIISTGASDNARKKNLYDVAGNLWEWTTEVANVNEYYILRSGGYHRETSERPVCFRNANQYNLSVTHYGFRTALYIK